MKPAVCPFCGSSVSLVSRNVLDPGELGYVYLCNGFPDCDAHVNCHRNSIVPMGTLADASLRRWRQKAHEAFDQAWRSGRIPSRTKAYRWLAEAMNLPQTKAHFAQFDRQQCEQAIALINALLAGQKKSHGKICKHRKKKWNALN